MYVFFLKFQGCSTKRGGSQLLMRTSAVRDECFQFRSMMTKKKKNDVKLKGSVKHL